MKYLVIIQARCGSNRLPNKVLVDLFGKSVLERVVRRVKNSKYINDVIVATSIEKNNLQIVRLCAQLGIRVFVGSENDVLDRYYQVAKLLKPEYVIRVTADCPLFDWTYLDMAIEQLNEDTDYMAEITESFPDGLDIEILKYKVLEEIWGKANMASEREHVTLYIRNNKENYKIQNLECPIKNIGNKRWTLDEEEDLVFINKIYSHFISVGIEDFKTDDVLFFLKDNPNIESINNKYERNEGLKKSIKNDFYVK